MNRSRNDAPGLVQRITARALQLRIVRALLLYSDNRGPKLADSITYRALFSVFAGVLLGFSIAALWLGGNPEAMRALTDALDAVIPGLSSIVDPSRIDAPTEFSIVGAASVLGLGWAAISAIGSLRSALRALADQPHDDRAFVWVVLRNLLVAVGFGGLLLASALFSIILSTLMHALADGLDLGGFAAVATRIGGVAVVFVIDTVAIALVFRVLSGLRVAARALWSGAALGAVGLVVLQELSGLFVRGAGANPLLGTFAALIALLIWFNLSAQVILIASCIIITAHRETKDRVREKYGARTLVQLRRRHAEIRWSAAARELRAAQAAEETEHAKEAENSEGERVG